MPLMSTSPNKAAEMLRARLERIESDLAESLDDGLSPDSYNIGWLEGARHELSEALRMSALAI